MKKINLFILALVCAFAFACGGNAPEVETPEGDTTSIEEVETELDEAETNVEEAVNEVLDSANAVGEEVIEEVTEEVTESIKEVAK